MNNTWRLVLGILMTGVLAALATPHLADKLPEGLAQAIAVSVAAMLHRMNASAPSEPAPAPRPQSAPDFKILQGGKAEDGDDSAQ